MRQYLLLLLLLSFACLAPAALAEEWTKSYQVGDRPSLRVETNDAGIEVSRGVSRTISARVVAEGYSIGGAGIRVTDRQDGDKLDLQVHIPNQWGMHFGMHRSVRIEIQVPPETALDLHSGDGHIKVDGIAAKARLDTGDGHIEVHNFNGGLDAHTGDGHMTIDGVLNDLNLRTGDGHIDLTVRQGSKMNGTWTIHTSDGSVRLLLPSDFAAELYAHTGDGHINSDFPITMSGSVERTRIRGKMNGGGPLLEISTGDGSIRIGKL